MHSTLLVPVFLFLSVFILFIFVYHIYAFQFLPHTVLAPATFINSLPPDARLSPRLIR